MTDLASRFVEHWPRQAWQDRTIVVAVSGGPDSVALLRLLADTLRAAYGAESPSGKLVVAHYNHRLRGAASDEDACFVQDLAESLGLECRSEEAPDGWQANLSPGQGLEAAARRLRYEFFQRVAQEAEARYLVTAHHRDDQIETVLHRILRGTGVAGLAGISAAREWLPGVGLVRPLLSFARAEILEYLDEIEQPFRHDASNDTTIYTRNKIRQDLLPQLREAFGPQVDASLWRLSRQAVDCQEVIADQVAQLHDAAVTSSAGGGVQISVRCLKGVRPYLIQELLVFEWRRQNWPRQEMAQRHWHQLADLLLNDNAGATQVLPGAIRARREADWLILQETRSRKE